QPTAVSLDVFLPDMVGWTVQSQLKQDALTRHIPVQVITLDEDRQHALARGAFSFVTKPTTTEGVQAALARIQEYARPRRKRMLERLNSSDEGLAGQTALLVDDDARNIFALSSVLERRGMKVKTATTGAEAIALVESHPEIAIVLMDIMMPQMDGYQTMSIIRDN